MKETKIVYECDKEDLLEAIKEGMGKEVAERIYSRFYSSFIDAKTVAKLHGVNHQTVLRYIKDGAIKPEQGEGQSYLFRASEALKFDFAQLRINIRLKKSTL